MHPQRRGVMFVLASGASFGLLPLFARTAHDHGTGPLTFLLVRFTLAAVGLFVIRAVTGRSGALPRGRLMWQLLGLGALGYAVQSSFYFYGVTRIDVSLATVIFYSYPVLVVLASWAVFRHAPTRTMTVSLFVVVAGTLLTAGQVGSGSASGTLLMFAASAWYVGYILVASRITRHAGSVTSLALVMVGAAIGHAALWPFHRQPFPHDTVGWLAIAGAAVVSTIVAMGFFFEGVSLLRPGTAAVLSTAEPVVSIGVGVVAYRESISPVRGIGAALVLVGVVLLSRERTDQDGESTGFS